MNKERLRDINWVKEFAPGCVGGQEVVNKATNIEIDYLLTLGSQIANHHNTLFELKTLQKNLTTSILRR